MRTVREIYTAYRIMPSLQMHQLRVAAVAKLIVDNFQQSIDTQVVLLSCLFHDMGNIIKSELSQFPEFSEPEGVEHWQGVKEEFVSKYGENAHDANVAIAREIGVLESVIFEIDSFSFGNLAKIATGNSFELKISKYGDLRTGPYGILSMQERLEEARARYVAQGSDRKHYTKDGFVELSHAAESIETQIFERCRIAPSDINDVTVLPLFKELSEYPVL